MIISFI